MQTTRRRIVVAGANEIGVFSRRIYFAYKQWTASIPGSACDGIMTIGWST